MPDHVPRPMRFSLGLSTRPGLTDGRAVTAQARAAEAAGFDALFVTDHPFPEQGWLAHGGHHALDPFVALSFAAAATTNLRLHLNLLVAAYRNPFLSAKAVASLDHLSGGRVILGIGAGYLEPEFAALGVDFAERNELTDEAIAAMKAAWIGDVVEFKGRHFEATANCMLPVPVQQPHPPIWIGGNSRRAIRRAVDSGDGWAPMPNRARSAERVRSATLETLDDLRTRLEYAAVYAETVGRPAPLEVAYVLRAARFDRAETIDEIAALRDAGVTFVCVLLAADELDVLIDKIVRFGRDIVS
jgi:probable F420-dependent oxidoreductase